LFQKGEDIFVIKNRKGGGSEVCKKLVEKKIYLTVKITTNITSVLYAKEEWKEEDGARL